MSDGQGQSAMGMISAVTGVGAVLGHGLCCVPLISTIAPPLVITLELVAVVTGFLARQQAAAAGATDGRATIGLVSGGLAMMMTLAYIAVFGAAVLAYLAMIVGIVVLDSM